MINCFFIIKDRVLMVGLDFEINATYLIQIDKNIQVGQKPNAHALIMAEIY